MDQFGTLFSALGSAASMISLFVFWKTDNTRRLRAALLLILILTAASSYYSYKYYMATRPDAIRKENQQALRNAAREFIQSNNLETSYWDPGKNEGIVKSGLALLEIYKSLIPDTYNRVRADVEVDIQFGRQHRDKMEQRKVMETTANNIVTLLKTLAGSD